MEVENPFIYFLLINAYFFDIITSVSGGTIMEYFIIIYLRVVFYTPSYGFGVFLYHIMI